MARDAWRCYCHKPSSGNYGYRVVMALDHLDAQLEYNKVGKFTFVDAELEAGAPRIAGSLTTAGINAAIFKRLGELQAMRATAAASATPVRPPWATPQPASPPAPPWAQKAAPVAAPVKPVPWRCYLKYGSQFYYVDVDATSYETAESAYLSSRSLNPSTYGFCAAEPVAVAVSVHLSGTKFTTEVEKRIAEIHARRAGLTAPQTEQELDAPTSRVRRVGPRKPPPECEPFWWDKPGVTVNVEAAWDAVVAMCRSSK